MSYNTLPFTILLTSFIGIFTVGVVSFNNKSVEAKEPVKIDAKEKQRRVNVCFRWASAVSGVEMLMSSYDAKIDEMRFKHCLTNGTTALQTYFTILKEQHNKGIDAIGKCYFKWGKLVGEKKRTDAKLFRNEFLKTCVKQEMKEKEPL